jgi:hypothetical protein
VLLQPRHQFGDLVNAGDAHRGELGDLLVDLRCRRLGDLVGGFSEDAIDTKAALIDPAA